MVRDEGSVKKGVVEGINGIKAMLIQTNRLPSVQTISKGTEHDSLHLDGFYALF